MERFSSSTTTPDPAHARAHARRRGLRGSARGRRRRRARRGGALRAGRDRARRGDARARRARASAGGSAPRASCCRSCCSRRGMPSRTAWRGSTPAPTTTSSSRSRSRSWWPACGRCCGAATSPPRVLAFGDDVVLECGATARRGGRELYLSAREADLLELLLRNARNVVPREPRSTGCGAGGRGQPERRRPLRLVSAAEARRPAADRDGARRRVRARSVSDASSACARSRGDRGRALDRARGRRCSASPSIVAGRAPAPHSLDGSLRAARRRGRAAERVGARAADGAGRARGPLGARRERGGARPPRPARRPLARRWAAGCSPRPRRARRVIATGAPASATRA